jgi:aminopeptidase N
VAPAGERTAPLPLSCYTFPAHRDRAAAFLREAAAIIRYYERLFGPYPYEKLAVVEIPLFPGGYGTTSFVMLIDESFAERRLDREFLAHEIAHQWWGNSVFPQGLGAAWLSEAFANYSAWIYGAAAGGNPRVLTRRVARAAAVFFKEAAAEGEEAILETDVYRPVGARDAVLYEKGAVVLHMLRREMGDAAFFRLLREFADRHRHGKAAIADFQRLAGEAAGRDLDWFFAQWLGRTGGMALTYSFRNAPEGNRVRLRVSQPAPAYRADVGVLVELEGSAGEVREHRIRLRTGQDEVDLPVAGRVRSVVLDPDGDLLMKPPRWLDEGA